MSINTVTHFQRKNYPKQESLSLFGSYFDKKSARPIVANHHLNVPIIEQGAQLYQRVNPRFEIIRRQGVDTLFSLPELNLNRHLLQPVLGKTDSHGNPIGNFSSAEERALYLDAAEKKIAGNPRYNEALHAAEAKQPIHGDMIELDEGDFDDNGNVDFGQLPHDAWREEVWNADQMTSATRIRTALVYNFRTDGRTLIDKAYSCLKNPVAIGVFLDWYLEQLPAESHVDLICAKLSSLALSHYLKSHYPAEISPRTGNTIFISACLLGLTDIVNWYLTSEFPNEYIQHVNRRGVNALMAAAASHNVSIIKSLIPRFDLGVQDDQGFTAFHHFSFARAGIYTEETPLHDAMTKEQREIRDIIGRTAGDLESMEE